MPTRFSGSLRLFARSLAVCAVAAGLSVSSLTPYAYAQQPDDDSSQVNEAANPESEKTESEKLALKQIILLSRSNLSVPLTIQDDLPRDMTPHQWYDWDGDPGDLTSRGGLLETALGQYFRKYAVANGLMKENTAYSADNVIIYSDSMKNCLSSAHYFAAGFMPTSAPRPYHRFSPGGRDRIFSSQLMKVSVNIKQEAVKQIAAMNPKGFDGLVEMLRGPLKLLAQTLNMENSRICAEHKLCDFSDLDTDVVLKINQLPAVEGALARAVRAVDALVSQYYVYDSPSKAAFGHQISEEEWQSLSSISEMVSRMLFTPRVVATQIADPILSLMNDELYAKHKFAMFTGHFHNLYAVCAALGLSDYTLEDSLDSRTPPGSKLMIQRWADDDHEYISFAMVYLTTAQMKQVTGLSLENPPKVVPLMLTGVEQAENGLYPLEAVQESFRKALFYTDAMK